MPLTCLVTIHGIGFQQPPQPGVAGYADALHARLCAQLPGLSDDPLKQSWQPAAPAPIYVHSQYPAAGGTREQGLARLGSWKDDACSAIDVVGAPLARDSASVAHVALVYANLEDLGSQQEATAETLLKAVAEHGHYNSLLSTLRTVLVDAAAMMHEHHEAAPAGPGGVMPRADVPRPKDHGFARIKHLWHHAENAAIKASISGTMHQLEDDICAYVARNDARERVRSFVRESLLRLAAREDVGALVLNTHSNGTVMGFDALRDLPVTAAAKVRSFITCGSPLRKYAELFSWGHEIGNIRHAGRWENYFDPRDPVADPLAHPVGWRAGEPFDASRFDPFVAWPSDAESGTPFPIADFEVDNLKNSSGGGLQAHNYWANENEFIPPLVRALNG